MQRSAPPPTPIAAPSADVAPLPATPPHSKIAKKTKALPTSPAGAAEYSPFVPELKLEKLMAANRAAGLGGNDMQRAGEEVAKSMSDLFKNIGSSMDNVLKREAPEEAPAKQRGTIIA
jgi:hypothetical protein